jgi:hypothetical protein
MGNNLMTSVQQAELQGKLFRLVEDFRTRNDLSPRGIFSFLVCFAWGYARKHTGSSNEQITNSMRALCETNELAYQRALTPRLPFDGGRS